MIIPQSQKIKALNILMLLYIVIFCGRALYWLHDRDAAMLWFLDTPFIIIVLTVLFYLKQKLIREKIEKEVGEKPKPKLVDHVANGLAVLLLGYVALTAAAMMLIVYAFS